MPATKSLQELREERDQLKKEILEVRKTYDARKAEGKKGDDLWGGPEGRSKFEGLDKRRVELDAEIKDIETEQRLYREDAEDRNDPSPPRYVDGINHTRETMEERARDRRLALRAWGAHGSSGFELDKETRNACGRLGFDPTQGNLPLMLSDTESYRSLQQAHQEGRARELLEKRSLSALQLTSGGALVGSTLVNAIELNMLYFGSIEAISEVILTDTGEEMSWPSADDTSNEGSMLGENQAVTSTDPTFAKTRWAAYEFSSDLVKAPRSLIQDAGAATGDMIGRMLGERVARGFNRKCTTGTGGSQPRGYVTSAGLGKTAASATAITRNEVVDLIHSVDVAYRGEGCRLVVHDLILAELRKLLDSQNRPLDLVQYDSAGQPRFKEGNYRIAVNNHQDSTLTTGQKVITFGDFTKGKIRRVRGIVVQRLVERYAEYNQIGFLTIVRQDYAVLGAGTDPIKYLKTA